MVHLWKDVIDHAGTTSGSLSQVANDVCEKALTDAKSQLHPLLQQVELERLGQRCDFLQAFKHALEQEIARKIVMWLPGVQAVYKFDAPMGGRIIEGECWDSTIHLLVLVPQLWNPIRDLGEMLDNNILKQLRRLSWKRFQKSNSIIEIQQVTPNEMRHGVSYGAMFLSLYAAPVQVWPVS